MHLKLVSDPAEGFKQGASARLELNGIDVSKWVYGVSLDLTADGPIKATVTFFLTGLDVDVPAIIEGKELDYPKTVAPGDFVHKR